MGGKETRKEGKRARSDSLRAFLTKAARGRNLEKKKKKRRRTERDQCLVSTHSSANPEASLQRPSEKRGRVQKKGEDSGALY